MPEDRQSSAGIRSKSPAQAEAIGVPHRHVRPAGAMRRAIFTPARRLCADRLAPTITRRASVLRGRNFRRFYIGYVTSLLGTSMSAIAVTFAVLDNGGMPADLGYVMTARILPQVIFVLGGGVLADRLGRRPVMLASDALRCAAQAALAAALLSGKSPVWVFAALAALVGTGEAFFGPALGGLT